MGEMAGSIQRFTEVYAYYALKITNTPDFKTKNSETARTFADFHQAIIDNVRNVERLDSNLLKIRSQVESIKNRPRSDKEARIFKQLISESSKKQKVEADKIEIDTLLDALCLQIFYLELKLVETKTSDRLRKIFEDKKKEAKTPAASKRLDEQYKKAVEGYIEDAKIKSITNALNRIKFAFKEQCDLDEKDYLRLTSICCLQRGLSYWLRQEYRRAFNDYARTEELVSDLARISDGDDWWLAVLRTVVNIWKGGLYYHLRNYEKASFYYDRAFPLFDHVNELAERTDGSGFKPKLGQSYKIAEMCLRRSNIFFEEGRFRHSILSSLDCLRAVFDLQADSAGLDIHQKTLYQIQQNIARYVAISPEKIDKEKLVRILKNCDTGEVLKLCQIDNELKGFRMLAARAFNQIGYCGLKMDLDAIDDKEYPCGLECDQISAPDLVGKLDIVCHWLYYSTRLDPDSGLANHDLQLYLSRHPDVKIQSKAPLEVSQAKVFSRDGLARKVSTYVSLGSLEFPPSAEQELLTALMSDIESLVSVQVELFDALDRKRVIDKMDDQLVILRRWSSYTPRIPRPRIMHTKGGGYFLIWNNKGIVIDPGFDFLLNLYEEGFSVSDIDAIIITHPHIDHIDDLYATLMCVWTRKLLRRNTKTSGVEDDQNIGVDLFLNPGTFLTYSRWIMALEGPKGTGSVKSIKTLPTNTVANLQQTVHLDGRSVKKPFGIKIDVKPSFHFMGIGEEPIGFVLYLEKAGKKQISIAFTGDAKHPSFNENYETFSEYAKCDLVVAHVGHVRPMELLNRIQSANSKTKVFSASTDEVWNNRAFREHHSAGSDGARQLLFALGCKMMDGKTRKPMSSKKSFFSALRDETHITGSEHLRFAGLEYLFELFKKEPSERNRLFVISELGEEMKTSRNKIAKALMNGEQDKTVALTGDIGLKIFLGDQDGKRLYVQCNVCSQDNDRASIDTFYAPEDIQEVCVKGDDQAIIYLCPEHCLRDYDSSASSSGEHRSEFIEHFERFSPIQ